MILGAEMVSDNGRRSHGIADEDGEEDHIHIHQHPVGSHPVLTGIADQLDVVKHPHQRHGDVAHQLRGAVGAGLEQRLSVPAGASQPQQTAVGAQEIDQRQQRPHRLTDRRGDGGARQPPAEYRHKQPVQHHIGDAGDHRGDQPQCGALRRHEKALKLHLHDIRRRCRRNDAPIQHAARQHLALGAQRPGDGRHQHHRHAAQNRSQHQRHIDEQGEQPVCLFRILFPQRFGHQSAAAGAEHKAYRSQQDQHRHDEIQRRKRGLSHIVGYKKAVHHAIDGGEYHHHDGGQREPQQPGKAKMVG